MKTQRRETESGFVREMAEETAENKEKCRIHMHSTFVSTFSIHVCIEGGRKKSKPVMMINTIWLAKETAKENYVH